MMPVVYDEARGEYINIPEIEVTLLGGLPEDWDPRDERQDDVIERVLYRQRLAWVKEQIRLLPPRMKQAVTLYLTGADMRAEARKLGFHHNLLNNVFGWAKKRLRKRARKTRLWGG